MLLTSGLAACSDDAEEKAEERQGDARPVAEQLAQGLTAGDLTDVPFDGDAATYDDMVTGADVSVVVEVADVTSDGDEVVAELAWSWEVGEEPWTYTTEARLVEDGDDWLVRWEPSLIEPSLVEGERLAVATTRPRRGEVLGRNGKRIVAERDIVRLGLDKANTKPTQVKSSARDIARAVGIAPGPYVKRATAAGDKAFVEAIVWRADEAERRLPASFDQIPGAISVGTTLPLAPTKEFAAPLLGSVGEATAEIIEKSEGAVAPGDVVGLSGLQARYDQTLRGVAGVQVSVTGGDDERVLHEVDPVDGEALQLTLDVEMQQTAEAILSDIDPASAIVALDPATGDVLVAASGPGGDGQNTATYGRYAPGSTMKVVTSLALLRAGMKPASPVACPATTVVDGKTFKNYDDYPSAALGRITLRQAVAQSCNTAFITQADELADDALTDAAAALGLGVDHDLGFPAYFGQVPTPEGETEKAADLIGQGKVLASPMAMAAVAASVRAGNTVLPRLVVDHEVDQVAPTEPLKKSEAKVLRELMRAVVTDGSGRFLAHQGGDLGAKTGTAEFGSPDGNGQLDTHTWMIAQHFMFLS